MNREKFLFGLKVGKILMSTVHTSGLASQCVSWDEKGSVPFLSYLSNTIVTKLDTIFLLKWKERNLKKQNMHGAASLKKRDRISH